VRAAAAVALGQSAGRAAVEPLLPLLADPSQEVRQRDPGAGRHGSAPAALTQLQIARNRGGDAGRLPDLAVRALDRDRRSRRWRGARASSRKSTQPVAAIVRERTRSEREGVALAAMFHHVLAPTPLLEKLALELALDESESPGVRCLRDGGTGLDEGHEDAREAPARPVRTAHGSAAFGRDRVGGRRRNAAVLPALQTAHELEAEPLTRGFI
jgi:hypothetical protein